MARRGIFKTIMGAIDRLLNLGGGAKQAPPPAPQEPAPSYEYYEPLPSQPEPLPPQQEEVTITEVTPTFPMGDNTEYIPGHMSGKNLKNPIYGRWRVTDPELGDISDIVQKVPQGRVTVVVCGKLEIYANIGTHDNTCKTYPFNTEDINALLDYGDDIEFAHDLVNSLLAESGDEWSYVSDFQVLNKEDDPRVQ